MKKLPHPVLMLGFRDYYDNLPVNQQHVISNLPLAAASLAAVVLLRWMHPGQEDRLLNYAGLALVGLVLLAAWRVPWDRLPYWAPVVLAGVDVVAITLMMSAWTPLLGGVAALTVFPVMWIAWSGWHPVATVVGGFVLPISVALVGEWVNGDGRSPTALVAAALMSVIVGFIAIEATGTTADQHRRARLASRLADVERQRAESFATALDATGVGVVSFDAEGRVLFRHGPMAPGEELATMADALAWERRAGMLDRDGKRPLADAEYPFRSAADGRSVRGKVVWIRSGGKDHAALVTVEQHTDSSGGRAGATVVLQNATELFEQLRRRENFLAALNHELRTPLTTILGTVELSLELGAEPDRRTLEAVHRNAVRMASLVEGLLSTVPGWQRSASLPVDLGELLQGAADDVRRSAPDGITVHVEVLDSPVVLGDPVRLEQLVANLTSNAVKYSPGGGAVRLRAVGTETGHVVLGVSDEGVGMDAADLERAQEMFYRSATARTSTTRGLGLGLAICREIAEAHGGTLEIESRPGAGTSVRVTLPAG
ncbi:HAMP domain-containing sensor histidine kinase [Zafaria sp. J156]|uniref:sensor histidine kinase n=1 Tax=Zafaria sp. J156 TaxID=3116490 RepID=UPI002E796127|nr:HAMP domain-containing sensor histidine kinase [Zafaria sp. J156]MEE1620498.1 HAMP domain-containing sensor histidine kinase [Zafaria sp. J156]